MNTKTTKFLAVLAVFAMVFSVMAVAVTEDSDAAVARGYQGYDPVSYTPTTGVTSSPVAVIVSGDVVTGYADLDAAITAATAGDEIILVKDIVYNGAKVITIAKALTVDLNGYKISDSSGNLTITIDDTSEGSRSGGYSVTFENGEIEANHQSSCATSVFGFGSTAPTSIVSLDLVNVSIETNGCTVYTQVTKTQLTVESSTITSTGEYGIGTNATSAATGVKWIVENSIVEANGSSVTSGVDQDDGTAIMFNILDSIEITNTTLKATSHGLFVRNGEATISDSDIIFTLKNNSNNKNLYQTHSWGTGDYAPFAAITIGDTNTSSYEGAKKLTIKNVTVDGKDSKSTDATGKYVTLWAESGDSGDLTTVVIDGTFETKTGDGKAPMVIVNYGATFEIKKDATLTIPATGSFDNYKGEVGDKPYGSVTGAGTLALYGTLNGELDNYVTAYVDVYPSAVWTYTNGGTVAGYYATKDSTKDTVITLPSSGSAKVLTFKQVGDATVTAVAYAIYGNIDVNKDWMNQASVEYALEIASGTTTLKSNIAVTAKTTVDVASGATLKMAAKSTSNTSERYTFDIANGAIIYVAGTMDISAGADFGGETNGQVAVIGGALKYYDPDAATMATCVKYQSGKVEAVTSSGTKDLTPSTPSAVDITSEDDLEIAIEVGAKDIKLTDNVTLTDDLVIPSGTLLTIDSTSGKKLTVPAGKEIEIAGATVTGTLTIGDIDVKATALTGNFTISPGSVYIDGVIASGAVELAAGNHHITGSLNGELTITASGAAKVYFDDFTVNATGKLVLDDTNLTYTVGGTTDTGVKYMYLYGTVVPKDSTDSITINVNKAVKKSNSFIAFAGAQLSGKVKVEGDGNIDISQAQNTLYIDEDISSDKAFGQLESVVIVGSLSIKNNSDVTVYGTLTVNEGVTLTIEKGSTLTVNSAIAKVVVNGRLIVEDGEFTKFYVQKAEGVTITGSLISSGTVDIDAGTVTVAKGGSIDIRDEDYSKIEVTDGLTIAAGGQMTVRSSMNIAAIDNKGTITLNGAVLANTSNISMAASGAILDIVSVTGNATDTYDLNITDYGLKFTSSSVVDEEIDNDVTISLAPAAGKATTFKGLTITEAVTSYELSGTTYYTNHMDLFSASMILVDEDSKVVAGTVKINGYTMEVNLSLTLGAGMTLSNAQNLYVYGEIDATAYDVTALGATVAATAGKITVYGEITTRAAIADAASYVNAAYYVEDVLGVPYHHYTLLATAIEDEADNIKIFGTTGVYAALEIPTDTIVTIDDAGVLEIGSSLDNSVVVLVKDGATIKNGTIKVYGAITFENKKNCKSTVDSDVTVENGDAVTYTSVYLAIANSKAGDVITITRIGQTKLPTSLTIPEDRTLSVPASRVLVLAPGTTLTVNGMLETAEKVLVDTSVYTDAKFADKASVAEHTAAIKVNGVFRSMAELTYAYYVTSGAYYTYADATGNYNYVSPVEIAVESTTKKITVYGTVIAGDVEWKGTSSSAKTFEVAALSKLTAGTLSFQYVTFDASAAIGLFSGTIQYGESSVSATEVDGLKISNPKYDDSYVMLVESVIVGDEDLFVISGGEVYVANVIGDMTIAFGATVLAPAGNDGFQMIGDLLVLGTLYVDNGRNATITNLLEESVVEVLGSIVVVPASEDGTKAKGNLTMDIVYVGTTAEAVHGEDATGIAAIVAGPMEFEVLVAAADAIISEEILEDVTIKSTKYYAENELYLTVYVPTANVGEYNVSDVAYLITTASFDGWFNVKGVKATDAVGFIGQTDWTVVTAEIDYDVYNLFVRTDNGIKSVAVNGKELINIGNNVFVSHDLDSNLGFYMSAGKYTISFTLKDGYEGTPILYDADGKAVIGGYGITIDGNVLEGETTVTYQLNGTDPIPQPEPTPTPEPEKESEWNVTTILLLVLVILIAIMAVIVALRLNRN